ncbi:S8 family serine peptidase [Rhodocytophaga rosea]|uniref:S8 family serine peptidase n=1 Tax=Rhodocytophaga rosea TaxID=2704465 RepID=A0A6C0GBZ5_9BACT|nr:S1/P1 nuclease [Rhodocytophaga rosea]QHT65343.1 S8 family serine peptidase [Rhodocytophaga rosea]
METVTLKRGRGTVKLVKSDNLIAIKTSSQAKVGEVLAIAPTETTQIDMGTDLSGFQIIKVQSTKEGMEKTLNQLRRHYLVDAGSHVYHTPKNVAPIVPTGKITLRFTPESTNEQRQQILDENKLEIIDSEIKQKSDGTKVETFTVRTTPDSLNPLKVAEKLQQHNGIVSLVEPDLATPGKLFAFQLPSDAYLKEQWHLENNGIQFGTSLGLKAGADARVVAAWQRMQSLGSSACIVAVIDDGFDLSHPDLAGSSKVVAPWDFKTNTNNPAPRDFHPDSRYGDYHGTACAGVAIGNASAGGIIGAAPNCRFMPVRWTGTISDDTVKEQFNYVANQGAWVVSCSWGVSTDAFTLSTKMDEAITECSKLGRNGLGCVIVFAAGNSNHDINDPEGGTVDGFATHPDVIAVAACNSRDEKSNYSNFGKEISICAPSSGSGGRGILTSDVRGTFKFGGVTYEAGYEAGDYTRTFGGTSSATPLVAGVCALLLSVNPSLTSLQVKEILERTARRIGNPASYENGHSIYFGYGCIDADAAVQQALALVATPMGTIQPTVVQNEAERQLTRNYTTLYGSEFWGISRHELIAGAAAQLLSQRARIEIARILAPLGNVGLQDIAGWADQIKRHTPTSNDDPDTVKFLNDFPGDIHRVWHYVNLPLGAAHYSREDYEIFTREDDVVQMIGKSVSVLLQNSNIMSELNALRWLTHLVGDVHQPIHVGCSYIDTSGSLPELVFDPQRIIERNLKSDTGGNSLVLPISGNISLHSYWDSRLAGDIDSHTDEHSLESGSIEISSLVKEMDNYTSLEIKNQFIAKLMAMIWQERARNRNNIVVAEPANDLPLDRWAEQWATNSLLLAQSAYHSLKIDRKLSRGKYSVTWEGKNIYDTRCKPIVSQQLRLAAENLAHLLNAIWQ